MSFMNHETQLDLRLAGSKELLSLLLKLILYTSFEVITGFLCPFNRRIRFKIQFHAIVSPVRLRGLCKQLTSKVALRKITSCKNVIWGDVRRRSTRPRGIPLALTKISRIDRLPFFLTHGALRPGPMGARGAPLLSNLRATTTS